jgi:hypothetical protein
VIVSLPTGADAAVHDPVPSTRLFVLHNSVAPVVNVTVPVGVPAVDVTVVEYVIVSPDVVEMGLTETSVEVQDGGAPSVSSITVNELLASAQGDAMTLFLLLFTMSIGVWAT